MRCCKIDFRAGAGTGSNIRTGHTEAVTHKNLWKEQFSLAYIRAVASVAECDVYRAEVDVNKIDVSMRSTDDNLFVNTIEIQAKCSARDIVKEDHLAYPLDVDTFNSLRRRKNSPHLLVVVTVPSASNEWVKQEHDAMRMHHCGYYLSLEGAEATTNNDNVTVHIPKTNIFSAHALREILRQANKDVKPL